MKVVERERGREVREEKRDSRERKRRGKGKSDVQWDRRAKRYQFTADRSQSKSRAFD